MELRHLKYLLAVADHQNFTRAAEALHVSQPTLSQQIKQLEHSLGVELFDRSGRTVRLTDAGAAYVHHARLAMRDLQAGERAVHDVRDLSRGHLRIAVTPTFTAYLVGVLVHNFRVAHPGIRVTVLETNQDQIEADLLADRLDLGIGFDGQHAAGIEARTLFTETLCLVVGTDHPLGTATAAVPISALADEPLGLLSSDFATRKHIDGYFAECQVQQHIAIESNSISALLELVRRNVVATVLPDAIARERTDLHPVPLQPPLPARTVQLLQRAGVYRSAAARAFTETLDTVVAARQESTGRYWSNQ
ncbi:MULTISPECIES: transcriptional regulator CynR [Mycobacteriaceae]|uniref:Transcriptional regulator CynR n=3 Tax=Mycobacteriaceae TaxID=1762 RepID=A0ABX3RNH8_MYCAL|nr:MULTISPECIES: transcriptional regulator CynR [Mycobacteriaceae]OQZ95392.1 transcriptional regulator CynR [Mycolicibacter algericus DSM 45454]BBX13057.1 transcription regulator LysR family protein [Mycobacterium novum]GFG87055.1 transcription regulator LysR family protein [Mycolicibacter algericus]